MDISVVKQKDASVITLRGRLDSATAATAQEKIMPEIVPDCRVVLDMSGCEYVSSAGVRLLLLMAKTAARGRGKVSVACMLGEIREVMEMTGFGDMFPCYSTVAEAVAGMAGSRP
jgi:anti-anti-sigma factor